MLSRSFGGRKRAGDEQLSGASDRGETLNTLRSRCDPGSLLSSLPEITMRILLVPLLALSLATPVLAQQATTPGPASPATATPAPAATPSPAQLAQRARMTSCNADASARNFKGQAKKDFMSACLGNKATPQVMMSACNAEATQDKMTADARKGYLATCLKRSGAS